LAVCGLWLGDPWSPDSELRTVDSGQRTPDNGQRTAAAVGVGGDPCEFEKCLAVTKPFFHLDSGGVGGCDWGYGVWTGPEGGGASGAERADRNPAKRGSSRPQSHYCKRARLAATFHGTFMRLAPTFSFPAFSIIREK